jgi:hypothetical protein
MAEKLGTDGRTDRVNEMNRAIFFSKICSNYGVLAYFRIILLNIEEIPKDLKKGFITDLLCNEVPITDENNLLVTIDLIHRKNS